MTLNRKFTSGPGMREHCTKKSARAGDRTKRNRKTRLEDENARRDESHRANFSGIQLVYFQNSSLILEAALRELQESGVSVRIEEKFVV